MNKPRSKTLHGYAARIRLVDGPFDGIGGQAATILRGRLECEGGCYLPQIDGDPQALYFVPNPIIVEARQAAELETRMVGKLQPPTTADKVFWIQMERHEMQKPLEI